MIDSADISYYTAPMSMGNRKRDRQPVMWVPTADFPTSASHPFYRRLNELLREHRFDDFVEDQCASFYAETMGRPGLAPGIALQGRPVAIGALLSTLWTLIYAAIAPDMGSRHAAGAIPAPVECLGRVWVKNATCTTGC